MSITPDTPSYGKKLRWRKSYLLLLPILLPFLLVWLFEFAVDPFPNSFWLTRFSAEQYFVHAQAELVVDGESLRADRMIRCFEYKVRERGLPPTIQAGDNLAFTTRSGRLFILPLLDACQAVLGTIKADAYPDPRDHMDQAKPLRLSLGQLATPVVFEVHGGREATQIDAYIARDRLLEGYHGVQLKEIVLEAAPLKELYQDWNGYEWFGGPSFARPYKHGQSRAYLAGYLVQVPKERWTTLTNLGYAGQHGVATSEEYRTRLQGYVSDLLALKENHVFQLRDPQHGLFSAYQTGGFILPFDSLDVKRANIGERSARVAMSWALNTIIPCAYAFNPKGVFTCDPSQEGILQYRPMMGSSAVFNGGVAERTFTLNNEHIIATKTDIAFLFRYDDQAVFVTAVTDAYMRR